MVDPSQEGFRSGFLKMPGLASPKKPDWFYRLLPTALDALRNRLGLLITLCDVSTHDDVMSDMVLGTSAGYAETSDKQSFLVGYCEEVLESFYDQEEENSWIALWGYSTKEEGRLIEKKARQINAGDIRHLYVGMKLYLEFQILYCAVWKSRSFTCGVPRHAQCLWHVVNRIKNDYNYVADYDGSTFDGKWVDPELLEACKELRRSFIRMTPQDETWHGWFYDNVINSYIADLENYVWFVRGAQKSGSYTTMVDNDICHKLIVIVCTLRQKELGLVPPEFSVWDHMETMSDDGLTTNPFLFETLAECGLPYTSHVVTDKKNLEFLGAHFIQTPYGVAPYPSHQEKILATFKYVQTIDNHAIWMKIIAQRILWYYSPVRLENGVRVYDLIDKCAKDFFKNHPYVEPNAYWSPEQMRAFWFGLQCSYAEVGGNNRSIYTKTMVKKNEKKISVSEARRREKQSKGDSKQAHSTSNSLNRQVAKGTNLDIEPNSAGHYLEQLINPEFAGKTYGHCGIPTCIGAGEETHVFPTINEFVVELDADNEFGVIVAPTFKNHIKLTGVLNDESIIGLDTTTMTASRSFVLEGTPGSSPARGDPHFTKQHVTFKVDDTAATPSVAHVADATWPMVAYGVGGYAQVTKEKNPTFSAKGYYFSIVDTPFESSSVTATVSASWAQIAGASSVQMTLFGSTSEVPTFSGSDALLGSVNNGSSFNSLLGNIVLSGGTALSSFKSFYCTMTITSGASKDLTNASIVFTTSTGITGSVAGTAGAYLIDAHPNPAASFTGYRCVAASLLMQDRSTVLESGGSIAGDRLTSSLQPISQSGLNQAAIAARIGAYSGDLSKGGYGFWCPVDMVDYAAYKDIDATPVRPSNVITAACSASGTTASKKVVVRVYAVWQVITYDPMFGPRRELLLNNHVSQEDVERMLAELIIGTPAFTCNPSHEQWTKLWSGVKNTLKKTPGWLKTGAKAATTGAEIAALIAALL